MKDRWFALLIAVACLSPAACVSAAVKNAVKAYAVAADQVAEAGQADVAHCQSEQDSQLKNQFCEKALKQFQTIRDSTAQLKNID